MPAVTVVVPAFNPGEHLVTALNSALAQTFSDLEIVVVDDGSDAARFPRLPDDSRVRVIRQRNAGVSTARNVAIAASSSDLIALLDADDVWHPHKLERQMALLLAEDAVVMTHTGFRYIDPDGRDCGAGSFGDPQTVIDLLTGSGVCLSSALVRRKPMMEAGLFNPGLSSVADWDLWVRLIQRGEFRLLDEELVSYRMAPHGVGQMSGDLGLAYAEGRASRAITRLGAAARQDPSLLAALDDCDRTSKRQYADRALNRFLHPAEATPRRLSDLSFGVRTDPTAATRLIRGRIKRVARR